MTPAHGPQIQPARQIRQSRPAEGRQRARERQDRARHAAQRIAAARRQDQGQPDHHRQRRRPDREGRRDAAARALAAP